MKNYVRNQFVIGVTIVTLGLAAIGCGESYKTKKISDIGRNPDNNPIENIIADIISPLSGCLDDVFPSSGKPDVNLFIIPDPVSSPLVQEQRKYGGKIGWYPLYPPTD